MTPAGITQEYIDVCGKIMTASDRARVWAEHCRREQKEDQRVWLKALAIIAIVAAFFAGFACAAVGLTK